MKDELHFYGDDRHFNPKWLLLIPAIALIVAGSILIYKHFHKEEPVVEQPAVEQEDTPLSTSNRLISLLDSLNAKGSSEVLTETMTVNDIPLNIYLPLNAHPTLEVGYDVLNDTSNIIMCFAAADAGLKDSYIIGSFVRRGEVLGKGISKKGFCAIINDTVTLGLSEESCLFEKAKSDSGYFFRQRALVENGKKVENNKDGEFKYRALCQAGKHLFVVQAAEPATILNFSQALEDFGVTSAISLQSAKKAKGWYMENGKMILLGDWESRKYPKTTNFICWRVNGK